VDNSPVAREDAAGGVKIVYDVLLLATFRTVRPPEEAATRK